MVIKMLSRSKEKNQKKTAEEFICEGGAEPKGEKQEPKDTFKMSFRCPPELMEKVDAWRVKRPGHLSRNQALIEIIDQFIEGKDPR